MNHGFSHILVPLDDTKESLLALQPAQKAVAVNGKLTLVHVAEDLLTHHQLPDGTDGSSYSEAQVAPIREYLENVSQQISRSDLTVETLIASGHPADAILNLVPELEVDAISLCTHLRSPLRRVLKGSTVQYLLHHCRVPLILVHDESEE